ncbi:MAG TPA: response regulator [Peptococcaceae bacterium]|nr:response regulator [Peptococcaceae bacterium]
MDLIRVFIIEDDPMVASINKQFTEKVAPFKVVGTSNCEAEAFQRILELKPDLILLDIFLPNGNGLNLLKNIRKENIPTDIVIVTAAKDTGTIQEALRYGAVDYLIKPFSFERLQQALLNYRNLRQMIDEHADVSQEELDQYNLSADLAGLNTLSSLPKGVHFFTLNQLLKFLDSQNDSLSCQEIADALSLSKITAWRYLEYLLEKGKVEVTQEYGSIGRPTKHYKICK